MEKDIYVKLINPDYILSELENIGFDKTYRHHAFKKNNFKTIKVHNLLPQEASILKQSALALGFDAAVHRGVLDCSIETSDALLTGSVVQFERLAQSISKQPFKLKKIASLINNLLNTELSAITIKKTVFDFSRTYLVGILNITPDSFSDGGKYEQVDTAISYLQKMVDEGADIIDIGAESTRPNHKKISTEDEICRLEPILKELKKLNLTVPVSIDTRNLQTAEFAIKNGVDLINDVGYDDFNYEMIDFVNKNQIPYIITHNKDITASSTDNVYSDLTNVLDKISTSVIADIGIGFGKSVEQNYELINRASEFKSLGVPIMIGHSRKSFISKSFDFTDSELDLATLAISSKLVLDNVNFLRVHNIKQHKQMIDVFSKLN